MNKQEELKSAEEILMPKIEELTDEVDEKIGFFKEAILQSHEEYADQFKDQLKEYGITMSKYLKIIGELTDQEQELKSKIKEKEQESIMLEKMCNRAQDHAEQLLKQLTKSNEMIDRLAEALDIFNRADANSGLQTSILKHNELIFIRKALTEYQNSKK